MFSILCGEGNISPEYFHEYLTFYEANLLMAGINRRYRASWQQSRLIADVNARCAGNKQGIKLEFPWERELSLPSEEDYEQAKQALKHTTEIANDFEAQLNNPNPNPNPHPIPE